MLNKRLALDLGTSQCRLFLEGTGIVADIPTVVAVSEINGKVIAIGEKAKQMTGRVSEGIKIISPVENGAISDFKIAEILISSLFKTALGHFLFFRPEVIVASPRSATQVEKKTLVDAVILAGAKNACLVDASVAGAVGAGLPIDESTGSMILNVGAGSIECAAIASGGIISSFSIKSGLSKIEKLIIEYVSKKKNVEIGQLSAEMIKEKINASLEVNGQDMTTGLPKIVKVTEEEIAPCFSKISQEIIYCIKKVFEDLPAELSADIIDKGIMMIGGGSRMRNLNKLIIQSTGIACHIAERPDTCVVLGSAKLFEKME